MLFNSYIFVFGFLPATLLIFFLAARYRLLKLATASLTVASLVFYSYWGFAYLPLLLLSILFNYTIGTQIERTPVITRKQKLLTLGIGVDLLLLAYYKYTNFFIDTWNQLLHGSVPSLSIVLPLGISFFTFTQIAYLVDAFRGETKKYNLLTYSLFVTFFPHLIAGPILHHKAIIPQFQSLRSFVPSSKNLAAGLTIFVLALFKKVVLADGVATWAQPVFAHPDQITSVSAWVGVLAYTLQLYFDFSAYSDMAIGIGLMLNIKLPVNFNSPYKATSIIDFWRRWHITLSSFLRDYLYIPLGGNRLGFVRRMLNLMITMLLGGLWHGAGWTFVIWGALHGTYLTINHTWKKWHLKMPAPLGWILTFLMVMVGWVFFRANSLSNALLLLKAMVGMAPRPFAVGDLREHMMHLLILGGLVVWVARLPNIHDLMERFKPKWTYAIAVALLLTISLLHLNRVSEFLYFQF